MNRQRRRTPAAAADIHATPVTSEGELMPVTYENHSVLVEKKETAVAVVTLNDPPLSLNSLPSLLELEEMLERLATDPGTRVIVLTGAGCKAFSDGADLSGSHEMAETVSDRKFKLEMDVRNSLEFIGKPTICAVEGRCMGGGLELACCCDIRIVSEKATFSQPELSPGLYPTIGGRHRLPEIVRFTEALEMMYLGEAVDAAEAYRIGLADKIAPAGAALEQAVAVADIIAGKPLKILRAIKAGVRRTRRKMPGNSRAARPEYRTIAKRFTPQQAPADKDFAGLSFPAGRE
jgi:enoyl-CoA hydratase